MTMNDDLSPGDEALEHAPNRLMVSWGLVNDGDWTRGNELMNALEEQFEGLIGLGAGTGFGRRDTDFELSVELQVDPEQLKALHDALTELENQLPDLEHDLFYDDTDYDEED